MKRVKLSFTPGVEVEFMDREVAIKLVEEWAERSTRFPKVVFGPEGCGKTAWLKQAAEILRREGYEVVYVDPLRRDFTTYTDLRELARKLAEAASEATGQAGVKLTYLAINLAKHMLRMGRRRVRELLEYFGLTSLAERFPETLSGGERQRIAVIRALANSPKIILADEPTSSIDDENSKLLMDLLSKINREEKVAILLTTTDIYEKLPTSRNFILKDGCLIEC